MSKVLFDQGEDSSSIEQITVKNNFRYERKFTTDTLSIHQIEAILKSHRFFFKEIFYKRRVNNIYFDTPEMEFYHTNKDGTMTRKKVRVRWYGETFNQMKGAVLEIKFRDNMLGDKWQFPLKITNPCEVTSYGTLTKILNDSSLPNAVNDLLAKLKPTLLNSYVRKYFQTSDKYFRVTLDNQLSYKKLSAHLGVRSKNMVKNRLDTIVELKYNPESDFRAKLVSDQFPFRLSKSSKYCDGIDLTSANY